MRSAKDRKWMDNVRKENGCWLLNVTTKKGYGKIKRNGKTYMAHRYAYMVNVGPLDNNMLVLHTCEHRNCINPKHLFVGTTQDQIDLKMKRGNWRTGNQKGENNPRAKLSNDKITDIRTMIKAGLNNTQIGKLFEVHHSTVSTIRLNKNWI